ncbi:hypothetical protein ABGT15_09960 [Flavobacterium enshiense]|uniref:hypothetical protein n=1 Tax=Flavobacterium enshiense TaxID=1341165 RepID=UPI00345D5B53
MKTIVTLLTVFPMLLNAQVGIGTQNPTAALHVAGTNSTIRIESQSNANYPTYNDGTKPAYSYVTANGDVTINPSANNGTSPDGSINPINFLNLSQNFIPDGPNNYGTIINNTLSETVSSGLIHTYPFTTTHTSLVEVKFSISSILSSTDLNTTLTPFNDISARIYRIYFCIDLNNNGLDAAELSRKYGMNAQSFASSTQGIYGYAFTNGHGYSTIPVGNHSLKFFAEIVDAESKFTSIGFGGDRDFIRIRIYN